MLTSAQVCRKKRILSTPDRSCHQAAPWSSLPSSFLLHGVTWHSFIPAVSIASYRLTLMAPSNQPNFGEIAINRNTYGITNRLSSLENDVPKSSDYQKRSSLGYHRSIQTKPLHKATRATFSETGRHVDDFYNRQDQTPALILFLDLAPRRTGKLVEVCAAGSFLGLVTEGPRRKRWGKYGFHCYRGCAGGQ